MVIPVGDGGRRRRRGHARRVDARAGHAAPAARSQDLEGDRDAGVPALLQAAASLRWGSVARFVTSLLPIDVVEPIAGASVGVDRLYLVAIAVALTAVLWVVYR